MGRHSQTLLNLAWSELFMWDGRMATLEEQVLGPLLKPDIMNQTMVPLLGEIESIPDYRRQFKAVFPNDPVNVETIAKAIATFERTIVSNKAPFDRWIDGDEKAISESAQRGFVLFNSKANCAACHNTWRFTDDGYHDIGIDDDDPGRGRFVPDVPVLDHAFKTPTLRNITQRAPYMHPGKIATLEDVVLHYATGFVERPSLSPEMHRLELTNQDIADLVEFMRALTSEDDPVVIPVLPTKETM
jgi:cytochrome c peroxidase